jgi:phytoene dehydrogenase-like protein
VNPTSEEVIVVGSGVGGLSCGILLARLGFSVTVIEKNQQAGGLMRSYTRDGIECPVGVHYMGALDCDQILRHIFEVLGVYERIPLERMGKKGVVDRYIFDDFTFDLPVGIQSYGQRLFDAFPDQPNAIRELVGKLEATSRRMNLESLLFSRPKDDSLLDSMESMGGFLNEFGCSNGLRQVLEIPTAWLGVPLEQCPQPLFLMTLASYLTSSWRLGCSGTQMAETFASRLRGLGGRILLGERVTEIHVANRSASGVSLESGNSLQAHLIVCAVHPKTVLEIVPPGAVRPAYRNRISSLEDTQGCLSVQVAVPAADLPARSYNLIRYKNIDCQPRIVFCQVNSTRLPDTNLLAMVSPSPFDDWRAWETTRTGRRGEEYRKEKEARARLLLKEVEPIFGPLDRARILDIFTPLSIRDFVGSANGSTYGVLRSTRQLLRCALMNRTPVQGLYLAGQSVTAPGILGTTIGSLMTVGLIVGRERLRSIILE